MSLRPIPTNVYRQQNLSRRVKGKAVQNNNHGRGAFYQANGVQNIIYHCYGAPTAFDAATLSDDDERENTDPNHAWEVEPYQTIIDLLSRIRLHVLFWAKRFAPDNTIIGVCDELDELTLLIQCTARSIDQIGKEFPLMFRSPFVSRAQQSAFEWTARLKVLEGDVEDFKADQGSVRSVEGIHRWSSLSQRLQTCIRGPRAEMAQFLRIIAASHLFRSLDIGNVEVGELVTKLSLTRGVRNPTVDTIWVREPTGLRWFSIPLSFCGTWEEFSTVIYEYCRNGPEMEYIREGNWAIVRDTDNNIIDQTQFTSVLKPEMRFDIGVIVRLASLLAGTCPQCGHQGDGANSVGGWVRCCNVECANLFRIVFQPPPKIPNGNTCKNIHARALSLLKKRAKSLFRTPISFRTGIQHLSTKFHRVLADVDAPRSSLGGAKVRRGQDKVSDDTIRLKHLPSEFNWMLAHLLREDAETRE